MRRSAIEKFAGLSALISYAIFGLSISALGSVSKLASVSAFSGLVLFILSSKRVHRIYVVYVCAYLFILLSWLWSSKTDWTPLGTFATALAGGLLCSVALSRNWVRCEALLLVLCIPALLNFFAFIGDINYTQLLANEPAENGRFSGLIGHPNAFVVRLTLPLIILTYLRIANYSPQKKAVWAVILLACLGSAAFGILASGSKKGVIFATISGAFWIWSHLASGRASRMFKAALTLIVAAGLTGYVLASFDISHLETVERFSAMLSGRDASTDERSYLLVIGWRLFSASPFFGYGLDEFSRLSGMGFYSHNNLIELLVSGGVFVALAYYGFVAYLLKLLYRASGSFLIVAYTSAIIIAYDVTGITASDRGCQIFIGFLIAAGLGKVGLSRSMWKRKRMDLAFDLNARLT